MRKWSLYSGTLILLFLSSSFNSKSSLNYSLPKSLVTPLGSYNYLVGSIENDKLTTPVLRSGYLAFKEALAFKESQGDYFRVNTLGYLGKYQFGESTLALFGINDTDCFLSDSNMQEKVFYHNMSRNKWILRRDIGWFVGKTINGISITESGILAAAHLAGAGNVKKFLRSNGKIDFQDAYGTRIEDYIKEFAGYDLTTVVKRQNPKFI